MTLRAKWIVCALLFVCMLATGAWLNRHILEDRPHNVIRTPASENGYRGFSSSESWSPLNYMPREYVKIRSRER